MHVHSQSWAHARAQAHSHMHTGTRVHRQEACTLTLILTHAPHTCVHSHTQVNTVTHSCTHTLAQHMQVHLCTYIRTRVHTALTHVCTRVHLWASNVHTHQSAHTGVHTFTRFPTTPGLGRGPGNPSRGSTAGPLAELWPPRASARAGLPPHPSTPVTLFAIKSLMLRQEKIAPF